MKNGVAPDELFAKVDAEKRAFLKRLVLGGVFAVPLMQSFSMDGLKVKAASGMGWKPHHTGCR